MALARSNQTALAPNLVLDVLREVLVQAGLCESRSTGEEGVFLTVESRNEVSVQYVEGERRKSTHDLAPSLRARAAVLKCYGALADSDYVLTLVSSPRTLTLHVRFEALSPGNFRAGTAHDRIEQPGETPLEIRPA